MKNSYLLHHLVFSSLHNFQDKNALIYEDNSWTYGELAQSIINFSAGLINAQISSQERVAIFLEKRFEFVTSCFGSSCAGNIFIPINPILKTDQIEHILFDSQAQILITTASRYRSHLQTLRSDLGLKMIVLVDLEPGEQISTGTPEISIVRWESFIDQKQVLNPKIHDSEYSHRHMVDTDAVSIFYTSGSTGKPKGVVLSHRNMVFGGKNVSSYLENTSTDRLLAVLPLSFDAGFSQLTTGFFSGAAVYLLNYLTPKDILSTVVKHRITGITAVPPLWIQISTLAWPDSVNEHLRYFANTGGKMPLEILNKLRSHFPLAKPFLMYGLTESFRSTYLPPDQIDKRPSSIGKAIPNAEILILKTDGTPCGPREPGELVHRGALVGLGYWNDPIKTAERYKELPIKSQVRPQGIVIPEIGVFSGDIVEMDEEGYIYFIGRNDEMMKTSGYRVSPMEVEEVLYNSGCVEEVAVFSLPHKLREQGIVAVIKLIATNESLSSLKEKIWSYCKNKMPSYMVPLNIIISEHSLPRNQNGKIDRKKLSQEHQNLKFSDEQI